MQTARLSDGATAYTVHGSDGPWVVLVHGLFTPSFAWEPLAETLAGSGFRVLRYDLLGRGLSDRPRLEYDLDTYVRQLGDLIAQLGIDAPRLVGWSLGGVVVTAYAAREATAGLVMIAPGMLLEKPRALRVLTLLPGHRRLIAASTRRIAATLESTHLSRPERAPDYARRASEQLRYPGVGGALAALIDNFPWQAGREQAAKVSLRPLIIWGDADQVTPYTHAQSVARLFTDAELVTVPGAKHAPHIDHPEIVEPAILRALSS
jgi:pimeloyl-ACP methyl ester carboxylesterase